MLSALPIGAMPHPEKKFVRALSHELGFLAYELTEADLLGTDARHGEILVWFDGVFRRIIVGSRYCKRNLKTL